MYSEDDLLPLSGLQHLVFCERQWGLIHLEQIWEENRLTADGRVQHERVHEQTEETRRDLITARGLPIHSLRLGLSGQADVIEFARVSSEKSANALELPDREGWWSPTPVEHKRGRVKRGDCDRVQLCAQALCLEEMFGVRIDEGALFYGRTRRRTAVRFTAGLRKETEDLAARMHELYAARCTPKARLTTACESCSLKDRCFPGAIQARAAVNDYYRQMLRGD
jgi:CRISPR-associated exonuclease Cas4